MFFIVSKRYFGFNMLVIGLVLAYFTQGHSFFKKSQDQVKSQAISVIKKELVDVPYKGLIEKTGQEFKLDAKLIASIVEVESSFKEKAKSHVGAKGLMQIMPVVAKKYDVKNAYNPKDNLKAGTAHFKHWMSIIEAESTEDKIKMTLAAYNAGLGHLRDAQRLAIKHKMSPHRWEHIQKAFVMLEDKKHHKKARYGYCQGKAINAYANKVYKTYIKHQNNVQTQTITL